MELTQQQKHVLDAIKKFMESDAAVFILRGYAGTGKTTMIKQMADYISTIRPITLMAPTGRAARVLHLKTGYEAHTIHRVIYDKASLAVKPVTDIADSEFKLHFPISFNIRNLVAIVDEASMVCARQVKQELFEFGTDNLMDDLLTYARPSSGGKIIFVGDPAQLPPVGDPVSQALNESYFEAKGLKVMTAELTEILRQKGDSMILKNALQIRNLLEKDKRNRLVFAEKTGEVECLSSGELLDKYLETRKQNGANNTVVICYSNSDAAQYNQAIRQRIYDEANPPLKEGDVLMVVQNNFYLDRMNGEFIPVLHTGEKVQQSAPVYVQEGGNKVRKIITLEFMRIQIPDSSGHPVSCFLLLNLLNNRMSTLSIDECRALYINFCMRHPHLKQGTKEFADALEADAYYNCLKAKYGYAVTGHKCQGGEWDCVFVDYTGRTGLSNDCLRWAYTATTRARRILYIANLPHITPFSKFRIEPQQACSKINEECRIIGKITPSPFHDASAPDYLQAKWMCIQHNMEWSPYKIAQIISKPYQEIYYIQTPQGLERYDIRYKKGGIFLPAVPQTPSEHSVMVCTMLNDEHSMPLVFDYVPSNQIHEELYRLIRSACDSLDIQITNVVEHPEDYSVIFYFRTSGTLSYLKIYINEQGFVTYAKPMSLAGKDDGELKMLIEEIQNYFI